MTTSPDRQHPQDWGLGNRRRAVTGVTVQAILLVSTLASAPPAASVPWEQAILCLHQSEELVARTVQTRLEVRDGHDDWLGEIHSTDEVTWQKAQPVWVNISKSSSGSPGFAMELDLHFEDHPASVLDGYDTWTHEGDTHLGDQPAMIWRGVTDQRPDNRVTAYLDPTTGRPIRADLTIPIHSNLGNRQVEVVVTFAMTPSGHCVPQEAQIDQAGRFLFWKRHLRITKRYEDWQPRPRDPS